MQTAGNFYFVEIIFVDLNANIKQNSQLCIIMEKNPLYQQAQNFMTIMSFLVHSDTEYRPIEFPVSHLCRI